MDFLDPKKKRNRKVRLMIGHALMVILVAFGSFILVLQAYGFDYNRKTGEVIQNGLLYLDSAPDGATIKLNGLTHNKPTNTRLSLPGGIYTVEISKEGYRSWQRTFELEGGKVERFSYPALYLNELTPKELLAPAKPFGFASQSPDRRWIVLQEKNQLNKLTVYDLAKRRDKKPAAQTVNLPANLLTPAEGSHTLSLVEWSTDNKNLLVLHRFKGGQDFAIINIDEPSKSFNINRTLNIKPSLVNLYDKKVEQLYIYETAKKTLRRIDVSSKKVTPVGSNVLSYKAHGDDKILMAITSKGDKKQADIILRENEQNHLLRQIPVNKKIPLDFARFDDNWYAVIGVVSEKRTYIYKNPLEFIKEKSNLDHALLLTLKSTGAISQVAFSQNSRFIMSQSGQYLSVYDAETGKRYGYKVKQPLDKGAELTWMDGHRLLTRSAGKILVFDFNGINFQKLIPANVNMPVMFDRDYTELYSISASTKDKKKSGFFMTNLRFEEDK
ncbi:PEGA domain-containing protein [Candidatus Parcubacteria bacterium]|nr:PEGA domain-containing protein [Candidatus Parcubacteria bacterium]